MTRILVTPRSLTTADHPALAPLREAGFEVAIPAPGKTPDPETLKKNLAGCAGWLAGVEKITAAVIAAGADLKVISRNGVGVDNIDLGAAAARGVKVVTAPGANARGVAELALGLMFALARDIPAASASVKSGGWGRRQGVELEGKVLGLAGCGRVGKILARLAAGIGMAVVGYDPLPDPAFSLPGFAYVDEAEVLRCADVISLHMPGSDRPFLDAAKLAMTKEGVLVINTARASAVDVDRLLDEIDGGRVAGYAVDAFDPEPPGVTRLTSHPRVICTSHLGGFTAESVMRAARQASENIVAALARPQLPTQERA